MQSERVVREQLLLLEQLTQRASDTRHVG